MGGWGRILLLQLSTVDFTSVKMTETRTGFWGNLWFVFPAALLLGSMDFTTHKFPVTVF